MRQFAFVGEAVPEVLGSCGELTAFSDLLAWLADGQWREIIKKKVEDRGAMEKEGYASHLLETHR